MENSMVTISVMALYEKFGEKLTYGFIRKTVDSEGEFYDLIVDGWKLATCDGEMNELVSIENGVYTLKNSEGDFGEVVFKLTQDEMDIAYYNNTLRFVGHQVSDYEGKEENLDLVIEGYFNDNPIWVHVDIWNGNCNVFLIEDEGGELDMEIDQSLITQYMNAKLYDEKGNMIMVS